MNTWVKMLGGPVVGLGVALAVAPVASAGEAGFINRLGYLNHYALECPGCVEDAIDVGYRACDGFGRGGSSAAVQAVLDAYNGPGQKNANYYATLFAQSAAIELCPQFNGVIGSI